MKVLVICLIYIIFTLLTGNMVNGSSNYGGNVKETKKKTDNCLPKHAARNMGGNTMIPSNKAFQKPVKSSNMKNGFTDYLNVT